MYKTHPDLTQPDLNQTIWHYYSLAKFMWLIDESSLYLCRNDKYDDSFEGGLTAMDKQYLDSVHPSMADYLRGDKVGCYYSNCWTKSDVDEYVLWNSYASLKDGIAVKSTVDRLVKSFDVTDEKGYYVSDVLYLDYEKDYSFIKTGGKVNTIAPHFTKRGYFQAEKELRVMYVDTKGKFDTSPTGVKAKVDLATLIEMVYVAPFSYPWLSEIIKQYLVKHGFGEIDVIKSAI